MPPILEKPIEKPAEGTQPDPAARSAEVAPLMKLLFEDIIDDPTIKPGDKKKDEPKPGDKKPDDPKAGEKKVETKVEDPKPGDTPVKVRKPKLPDRPALPAEVNDPDPAIAEAAKRKAELAKVNTPPDDSDLEENERDMISDAEFAEKRFPDKHKGLAAKTRKFIRDHVKYIEEHGGEEFDDQSPEYLKWLSQNRVSLSPSQVREINETRIVDKANETTNSRVSELEHERYVDRQEPAVRAEASKTYSDLARLSAPAEILEELKTRPYAEVYLDFKPELDVLHSVVTAVADDVAEFERISRVDPKTGRPMVLIATDPTSPKYEQHARLQKMVQDVCENFNRHGTEARQLKDGRWFVTRDEYHKIKSKRPDLVKNYWTFSNKEIMRRSVLSVPAIVAQAIKAKREKLEADGYVRKVREKKKEEPKPGDKKPEDPKGATPASHPKKIPGGDDPGAGEKSQGSKLAAMLKDS